MNSPATSRVGNGGCPGPVPQGRLVFDHAVFRDTGAVEGRTQRAAFSLPGWLFMPHSFSEARIEKAKLHFPHLAFPSDDADDPRVQCAPPIAATQQFASK
jgi:hypothetical protein